MENILKTLEVRNDSLVLLNTKELYNRMNMNDIHGNKILSYVFEPNACPPNTPTEEE